MAPSGAATRHTALPARSLGRIAGVLCVGAALSLAPASVFAQNATLVQTGHAQYDNLQYEEAIQTLSAAIIRRGNTPAQEVQIYELLGLSYLALARNDEAEGAFRLALAREPGHALDPNLAPRVLEFYSGVRQRWIAEGRPGMPRPSEAAHVPVPVVIEHRSPPTQDRGNALELTANVVDPDRRAAGLVLAWRQGSRGLFHRVSARGAGGAFSATVPGTDVRPPVLEYYLEAVDPNGIAVTSRGDAFAPLRVVVPADVASPIWSRWWFWTGAAVVVTGVAVLTYFLVSSSNSSPGPAQLTINVTGN